MPSRASVSSGSGTGPIAEIRAFGLAVPVGASGRHEAQPRAQPLVNARCAVVVVGPEALDAAQAGAGEARDEALERGIAHAQRVRVREHGRAAALGDELDGLLRSSEPAST